MEDYGVIHFNVHTIPSSDTDAVLLAKTLARATLAAMHSVGYAVDDAEWVSLVVAMEDVKSKLSVAHVGKDGIEFRWSTDDGD